MRMLQGNFVRFSSLCLLGAAATVAGSAHGQQMVFDSAPVETFSVSAPTVEQCSLADRFNPGEPQSVVMANQLPAACGDVLADHMQSEADAHPDKVHRMYRPDPAAWPENLASTTPENLRDGLLDAFVESDVRLQRNDALTYGNAMLAMTTPVDGSVIQSLGVATARSYNAHPDWTARGTRLGNENPCGEWVWKGYYDYSRFEDAANACGTDNECIYQVAFADSPNGIAYRTDQLTGHSDGRWLRGQLEPIPLLKGYRSKNPFFGVSTAFLIDQQAGLLEDLQRFQLESGMTKMTDKYVELQAGPKSYSCASDFRFRDPASKYYVDPSDPAATSKLAAISAKYDVLRVMLEKKAGYLIDPPAAQSYLFPQAERFDSEWHFHKAMHDRQKPVEGHVGQPLTAAERAAIDERTETLLDLIEKYTLLTSAIAYGEGVPDAGYKVRNPVDELVNSIINPVDETTGEVVNPVIRRPDAMVRSAVVSTMRRDLVPSTSLNLLSPGDVAVTSHVAVPMRASRPAHLIGSPYMSEPVVEVPPIVRGKLVGTEADYGVTTETEPASVTDASTTTTPTFGGYLQPSPSSCPSPMPESDATVDAYDIARAAQKVQEQIVALLLDEYERGDHGCLSENGYNCDWSPALFASRFTGHYAKERENLFQYCVLMSGGNTFDNPDPTFAVPEDARTTSTFGPHLNTVRGALAAQLADVPYYYGGPSDDRVGEKTTGGKSIGDPKWFGAGYEYEAGWSVKPVFRDGAGDFETACAFRGKSNATFNAHISILGQQVDVVDVVGSASASHGTGSFGVQVEFLGKTFEPIDGAAHFHHVETGTLESNRSSATVVVVVVPVTFQAFGELEYGYDVEAEARSNDECGSDAPEPELALRFQVKPFARINAVASAAVGVSGAQAGVRGRIAMLDADLPLQAGLAVKPDPDMPSSLKLFPSASADFRAATLSGRMSAFAEVGAWPAEYEAEKTIYSWRGIEDTFPLWQLDTDEVHVAAFSRSNWDQWRAVNAKGAGQ